MVNQIMFNMTFKLVITKVNKLIIIVDKWLDDNININILLLWWIATKKDTWYQINLSIIYFCFQIYFGPIA